MKNIHIIPTDKPSRLSFDFDEDKYLLTDYLVLFDNQNLLENRNIYITSDEEIKEGDWVIQVNFEKTNTQLIQCVTDFQVKITNDKHGSFTKKKIILTTDQDLINDGVQAIDDEFLEWFVKNPSCEEVEIKKDFKRKWVDGDYFNKYLKHYFYKIIIPKEEPKQCDICNMYPRLEGTNKCESCYSVIRHFLEQDLEFKDKLLPDLRKKQETLEEITEQIQKDCHKFVESIISKVTYQDATNTFLFMKLAELTLKLKKYE